MPSQQEFDLIVLDIMMPHFGRYKVEQTEEGLKTGVFVFGDIRKFHPKVPVIVHPTMQRASSPETFNGNMGNDTIHGNFFSGPNAEGIAFQHASDGYFHVFVVSDYTGGPGGLI